MKKVWKLLALVLVGVLLLSLAACSQQEVLPTTDPIPGTTGTQPTTQPTTQPDKTPTLYIDLAKSWAKPDVESAYCAAFSDAGYYYLRDGYFLSFMDTENGISVTLCQKVGCTHSAEGREECEAALPGTYLMFYDNGYIYYNKLDGVSEAVHLFRRREDGTAEEKVAVLGEGYFASDNSIYIGELLAADGILYYTLFTQEILRENEEDIGTIVPRDGILMRMDLRTGQQKELLRQRDVQLRLLGARSDALLFYAQDLPSGEQMLDGTYNDVLPRKTGRLKVWQGEDNSFVTLFQKKQQDCDWILGMQNGKVYYYDLESCWTYDLAADVHAQEDLPYGFQLVSGDYIFVGSEPGDFYNIYSRLMNLQTGQYLPGDFDNVETAVKNRTDRGVVLEIRYHGEPYVNDLYQTVIPRLKTILAYVDYDALADGLQNSDLMIIREANGI